MASAANGKLCWVWFLWIMAAMAVVQGWEWPNLDLCKNYFCGMGTCRNSSSFPYVACDCQRGWNKIASSFPFNSSLQFLPCVIPNCTFNYTCAGVASPAPAPVYSGKFNGTLDDILNPCPWNVCGEGRCDKSNGTYSCICNKGYRNLMNQTFGYCAADCQIGADCSATVGIGTKSSSVSAVSPAGSVLQEHSNGGSSTRKKVTALFMAAFMYLFWGF